MQATTVTIPPGFRAVIVPIASEGVDAMLEQLKQGQSVLCPKSKRGWLIGKAKAAKVFTKSQAVEEGFLFEPCAERPWKGEGTLLDSMPIEKLGLSVRSQNGLICAELRTVGDIRTKTLGGMLKCRTLGQKSLKDIQASLRLIGVEVNWYPV